jgi:hypothetical protein
MVKFKTDTIIYGVKDSGTAVFRDERTLGYLFINTGNCPVLLNNFILLPNSSLKTYEPNSCDCTVYRMNFKDFNTCTADYSELTVLIYNSI